MKEQIKQAIIDSSVEGHIDLEDLTNKLLNLHSVINWVAYDFMNLESRPPEYGKYLVVRKDGKTHWETWNGSGWAYNEKVIRYWAVIVPPCL